MESLKEKKEAFVSNLNGTTPEEIDAILLSQSGFLLAFGLSIYWLFYNGFPKPIVPPVGSLRLFLIEFVSLVCPLLLVLTVASGKITTVLVVTCVASAFMLAVMLKPASVGGRPSLKALWTHPFDKHGTREFLNAYRAYVGVTTAVCILGVDFGVFPRRFGKVETFGTGLMDLPVGCYILSNSIVSSQARRSDLASSVMERMAAVPRAVRSSTPLLILGVLRLVTTKGIGYQEHVTEYGVHWNFFFTLAAVKIACTCAFVVFHPRYAGIVSLALCALYEGSLEVGGLKEFALAKGHRSLHADGFIVANREGVVSTLGFCALYMGGVWLGRYLFLPRRRTVGHWIKAWGLLMLASLLFYVVFTLYDFHVARVSRRLANLPYILWMFHCNMFSIGMMLAVSLTFSLLEKVMKLKGLGGISSQLLAGATYNGLLFFLLANLLTGAVNVCVDTLAVEHPVVAVAIITGYMAVVCYATYLLKAHNISTKFW